MDANLCLFPKSAKWPLWPLVPLFTFLEVTGCVTVPEDYTLVLRDGIIYVCVDALHKDRCYKAEADQPPPNGIPTPE